MLKTQISKKIITWPERQEDKSTSLTNNRIFQPPHCQMLETQRCQRIPVIQQSPKMRDAIHFSRNTKEMFPIQYPSATTQWKCQRTPFASLNCDIETTKPKQAIWRPFKELKRSPTICFTRLTLKTCTKNDEAQKGLLTIVKSLDRTNPMCKMWVNIRRQ